jgi:Arc/MetJ-type ribon-helix-helix transcriptional regulator
MDPDRQNYDHPINVRIPADLLRLIEADVARRNGDRTWRKVTRSDVIRLLLRESLDDVNVARRAYPAKPKGKVTR